LAEPDLDPSKPLDPHQPGFDSGTVAHLLYGGRDRIIGKERDIQWALPEP
jgi:hypothetical protein